MLGNQLLNSVPRFDEDLDRLKGRTSCTPLVKPVRGDSCDSIAPVIAAHQSPL